MSCYLILANGFDKSPAQAPIFKDLLLWNKRKDPWMDSRFSIKQRAERSSQNGA